MSIERVERLDGKLKEWAQEGTDIESQRERVSSVRIDFDLYTLGYILDSIAGDDNNCFPHFGREYGPEAAQESIEAISIRLEWEIAAPQLPEEIKVLCRRVLERLTSVDCADPQSYKAGWTAWKAMSLRVGLLIQENLEYKWALDYSMLVSRLLSHFPSEEQDTLIE